MFLTDCTWSHWWVQWVTPRSHFCAPRLQEVPPRSSTESSEEEKKMERKLSRWRASTAFCFSPLWIWLCLCERRHSNSTFSLPLFSSTLTEHRILCCTSFELNLIFTLKDGQKMKCTRKWSKWVRSCQHLCWIRLESCAVEVRVHLSSSTLNEENHFVIDLALCEETKNREVPRKENPSHQLHQKLFVLKLNFHLWNSSVTLSSPSKMAAAPSVHRE